MTLEERFWAKVDKTDGCWLWTACKTQSGGYGLFWDGCRLVLAHRFVYALMVGVIPDGMNIDHRHTCPKNCVNPGHLRVAAAKQNSENRSGAQRGSRSGVRGVSWNPTTRKWQAAVWHNGKKFYAGEFSTIEAAGAAAASKRMQLFTHSDMDLSRRAV